MAGSSPARIAVTTETSRANASMRAIDTDFRRAWNAGRIQRQQQPDADLREDQAEKTSTQREHTAFEQRQPEQPAGAGTQRAANGHLADARLASRHHQAGDVGADDQQHESGRTEQRDQRRTDRSGHLLEHWTNEQVVTGVDVRVAHLPSGHDRGKLRARGLERNARCQPPDRSNPVSLAVARAGGIDPERNPDSGARAGKRKSLRHDPDDRGRHAVHGTVRPTTDASPPNRLRQYPVESTATAGALGRSSSVVNVRPSIGDTRSSENRLAETAAGSDTLGLRARTAHRDRLDGPRRGILQGTRLVLIVDELGIRQRETAES